jgi:RHS repeat-associated protein
VGAFGFAGKSGYQEDSDSFLKLLGHRYYDPSTGRFLTRDPAKDGRNWYAYCENNPTRFVDPSGNNDLGIPVMDPICTPYVYQDPGTAQNPGGNPGQTPPQNSSGQINISMTSNGVLTYTFQGVVQVLEDIIQHIARLFHGPHHGCRLYSTQGDKCLGCFFPGGPS